MSKDSYWFRHDSTSGRGLRIRKIQHIYGHWGKGVYWDVIEVLREQDNYEYPCDDSSLEMLADLIGCKDVDKFLSWFNDCIKHELFTKKPKVFYSEVLKENMSVWETKKDNGSKGGRPKKETELKPNQNLNETEIKPDENHNIIEYNNREYIYNKEEIIYDLYDWLKETHYPKLENWNMQHKLDMKLVCDAFIKEKLSEHFNGDNHIINSLKKFIPDFAKNRPDNTGRVILPKVGN